LEIQLADGPFADPLTENKVFVTIIRHHEDMMDFLCYLYTGVCAWDRWPHDRERLLRLITIADYYETPLFRDYLLECLLQQVTTCAQTFNQDLNKWKKDPRIQNFILHTVRYLGWRRENQVYTSYWDRLMKSLMSYSAEFSVTLIAEALAKECPLVGGVDVLDSLYFEVAEVD